MGMYPNGAATADIPHLVIEGLRTVSGRVDSAIQGLATLREHVEEARREDFNRIADKLERGFEQVAHDAREREGRLNTRLDRMDDKLADVCDRGRKDHDRFEQGIHDVARRLDAYDTRAEERRRLVDSIKAGGKFVVEHGKDIVYLSGFVLLGLKLFWPATPTAQAAVPQQVTIQQPAPSQAPVEDWMLRTN